MLLTLALGAAAQAAEPETVRVVFVRDGVFPSPNDDAWAEIPETTCVLQPQLITAPVGGGSTAKVSVRATHDGEEVAFRLQWSDSSAAFRSDGPKSRLLLSWEMRSTRS
jgi:hypothetical protein